MEKYTNASAATWARTICLIVALLNSLLASFNKSPLPIDNEQLQQLVSTLITVVVAIINWWKNNSFTKEAIEADELQGIFQEISLTERHRGYHVFTY